MSSWNQLIEVDNEVGCTKKIREDWIRVLMKELTFNNLALVLVCQWRVPAEVREVDKSIVYSGHLCT